ncbi:hypothetical protein EZS27_019515 [termite gut metagenome]|uniref:Uncharacterized protein n=1 Tax=termite gut metagenome TaxID=433724 RepID=A0A5J4RFG6_9ZZZZ
MLPIPNYRKNIAGKDQKLNQLEVELLLTDDKIKDAYGDADYATEKITNDLSIPKIKNKNDFWRKILGFNKSDLNAFQPLFNVIDTIFNINNLPENEN